MILCLQIGARLISATIIAKVRKQAIITIINTAGRV